MRVRPVLLAAVVAALIVVSLVAERVRGDGAHDALARGAAPAVQPSAARPAPAYAFFDRPMPVSMPVSAPVSTQVPGPASTQVSAPVAAPDKPAPSSRTMQRRFERAPNLRAFFYDALGKPAEGGYYYAFQVLALCRANEQSDQDGVPDAQHQAIEALRERCDFSARELDDASRQLDARRDVRLTDDPVLNRLFADLQAKDPGTRMAVLAAAIDDGNPEVIASLVARTARQDGQRASDDAGYTMALVECQLGADCAGDQSLLNIALCVRHGWCADNVRDALHDGLGDRFGPIDALATQLTSNVRKRNYGPLFASH